MLLPVTIFARVCNNRIILCKWHNFIKSRNAVIGNLAQVENRNDVGELWENFVIAERLKQNAYTGSFAQSYFWRTRLQHEIDYLEEVDGQLKAFEFKWNTRKANVKCPESFSKAYPDASFHVITPENIEEFLLNE